MGNTVGSQQNDIIIGSLLGDSFLERNGRFVRLIADHSILQKSYVEWKAKQLSSLKPVIKTKNRYDKRAEKEYGHCIMRTATSPLLEEYFRLFYRGDRVKKIPINLPKIINGRILATWIMDDGYKRNDCNALRLNTQGYNRDEQGLITKALEMLSISSHIQKHKSKFVIYIPSRSMFRLREETNRYIISEMRYKIA